jgi:hypothetical protein
VIGPWLVLAVIVAVTLAVNDQITRQSFWQLRDRWIWLSAWLACALLTLHDWPLGAAWASVIVRWHAHENTPPRQPHQLLESLVVWVAILGWYLLVQSLPPQAVAWLPALFTGCMVFHSAAVVGDWHWRAGHNPYFTRGWAGQRQLSAALLAMLVPFAWSLHPLWALLALPGLFLLDSWLAWLALVAAAGMWQPWTLAGTLPLILGAVAFLWSPRRRNLWDKNPRGTSLDGPLQRVYTNALMLVLWIRSGAWVAGRGPDASLNDIVRAMYRYFPHAPDRIISGHVHNEYVEWAYEGGALAILAMCGLAYRVGAGLHTLDPWSASALAGAVLAGGTVSTKSASTGLVFLTILAVVAGR